MTWLGGSIKSNSTKIEWDLARFFPLLQKKVSLSYFFEKLFEAFDYEKCRKFETLFSTIASHEILNRQKATFLAGQESTADLGTG